MEVFKDFDGEKHILSTQHAKEHEQLKQIASDVTGGKSVVIACGDGIDAARIARILEKLSGKLLKVTICPPEKEEEPDNTEWMVLVKPKGG